VWEWKEFGKVLSVVSCFIVSQNIFYQTLNIF